MRLPAAIRRIATVALLPVVLLAGAGPAGTFFFCTSMQEVMASTCCPVAEEQTQPKHATLDEAPCCEQFTVAPATLESESPQRPSHQLASPPLAILAVVALEAAPRRASVPAQSTAWSNTGPPVLDRIEALLI